MVRNRLMWVVLLPLADRVMSRSRLLPRTMSGSVVLLKPGSVVLYMAPVTTKGCANSQGLCHHLRPGDAGQGLRVMMQL